MRGKKKKNRHSPFSSPMASESIWPLDSASFDGQPISTSINAILSPHSLLASPHKEAHDFQIHAAVTMNVIWFARNNLVYNDSKPDIPDILRQICSASRAHKNVWVNSSSGHNAWKPPPLGRLKVNFDVAIRSLLL